jgi:nucleoside-diphosphate-sugar epimerase
MSGMKVVVTGGAGYVGAVVAGYLLANGMEITVFDRLVYGGESLLSFFAHPRFRFVKGDVRQREGVMEALTGADAVVHLAAIVGEAACAIDESAAWSVNYGGAETALAAARECGVPRFVFMSTCSNYGISDPSELADESFPLRPISQYARAKVEAEQHVLAKSGNVCTAVLRFGTICGLSPRMRFDLLVSEMARSAALGDPIHVFAPAAWRPFLHIRDAARAILECLGAADVLVRGKIFNVVGENCRKKHLVDVVLKHYPGAAIAITEKRADLRDYRASGELIRRDLGYVTRFTVEDAFIETAAAVSAGVFRDPRWAGHSAVPLDAARVQGN